MKRVPGIITLLILVPFYAWSMSHLTDDALSGITGQAGVSINPDITMNLSIQSAAWGDSTGLDGPWDTTNSDMGGYMGVNNLSIQNLHVRSRSTDTYNGYDPSLWKPVTIDVAMSSILYDGATFVRIGIGALEVSMDYIRMDAATGQTGSNLNQKLGEVYLGGLHLYLNPVSYIDIYNGRSGRLSGETGVNLAWYSLADRIEISSISWGDSDGLPAGNPGSGAAWWMEPGTSAGYVGLADVVIDRTSVIGTFTIDVATSSAGVYRDMNGGDVSVVHVSFPTDFQLHTGRLTADVKLDRTPQLNSVDSGTLGNIYIDQFDITILNGSWVDLWAH